MTQPWTNVPCPGCGCVCDDVRLALADGELIAFDPPCELGAQWFRRHGERGAPAAQIAGQPASLGESLDRAAALLRAADYPLVYGLSRSTTAGQRAAVALAERLGGAIDTTASLCHGPSIMALQEVGEVTSTLGEVRNRADLVVFWGCHPAQSHPRHAERYSVFPRGRYVPRGREGRTVVMVGDATQVHQWRLDPAGARPDLVVPVPPGEDFEALSQLRTMLRGGSSANVPDELRRLLDLMQGCRYGVVFFGLGIAETSMWDGPPGRHAGHVNVAALLQLVAELNAVTRFTARRMRLQGDVSGADNVMCWQTGYPFAVDMSRGYPRYNPGEFTASELLASRQTDLCLLVGAETVPYFPAEAREHLQAIPTILLDYPGTQPALAPTVRFTTSVYGLHSAGTAYRMDNVPLTLRAMLPSQLPSDEWVLGELARRL
ncbi:MAG: formylmethanofuran dehydrogenase subunit B [Pirellulaceae bacterium]|nr:formylmethanofuran dehydrogenase subunit B [Pirellulaceae bacterium]